MSTPDPYSARFYFLGPNGLNFVDNSGVHTYSELLDPYSWSDPPQMKKLMQSIGNFVSRIAERVRQTAQTDAERSGLGIPDEAKTLPKWANRAMKRYLRARGFRSRLGRGATGETGCGIARRIAAGGKVRGY